MFLQIHLVYRREGRFHEGQHNSNPILAEKLKMYSKNLLFEPENQEFPLPQLSIKKPLVPAPAKQTKLFHLKQFHHSFEIDYGAKLAQLPGESIHSPLYMEFLRHVADKYIFLPNEPEPGTVGCAFKKMSQALRKFRKIKFNSDSDSRQFSLVFEEHLREAGKDIVDYLEYGSRYDLIVESQRNILLQLDELHKKSGSLAILNEAMLINKNNPNITVDEIKKAFKNWTPGKETFEQSNLLFRHGAALIFSILKDVKIFGCVQVVMPKIRSFFLKFS